MTDQTDDQRDVEIRFERTSEHFEVTAALGGASIVLRNLDEGSDDDMVTLVTALPGILDAVAEHLTEQDEEEADRG